MYSVWELITTGIQNKAARTMLLSYSILRLVSYCFNRSTFIVILCTVEKSRASDINLTISNDEYIIPCRKW